MNEQPAPAWTTEDLITRLGAVRESLRTRTTLPDHAEATPRFGCSG